MLKRDAGDLSNLVPVQRSDVFEGFRFEEQQILVTDDASVKDHRDALEMEAFSTGVHHLLQRGDFRSIPRPDIPVEGKTVVVDQHPQDDLLLVIPSLFAPAEPGQGTVHPHEVGGAQIVAHELVRLRGVTIRVREQVIFHIPLARVDLVQLVIEFIVVELLRVEA